jgi:hypothetical protein
MKNEHFCISASLKFDKLYFKEFSDLQRNVLELILKFECISTVAFNCVTIKNGHAVTF